MYMIFLWLFKIFLGCALVIDQWNVYITNAQIVNIAFKMKIFTIYFYVELRCLDSSMLYTLDSPADNCTFGSNHSHSDTSTKFCLDSLPKAFIHKKTLATEKPKMVAIFKMAVLNDSDIPFWHEVGRNQRF